MAGTEHLISNVDVPRDNNLMLSTLINLFTKVITIGVKDIRDTRYLA